MPRSERSRRALFGAALAMMLLVFSAPPARAEPSFDGRWKQGPLQESFTIQTWLNACGPAPKSSSTGGGETVSIRVEGDELAFMGGGRVYRTNQCYDPMPTLSRESHSRDPNGRTWRTRCTTPPNDPRKAILNTLVAATTDSHIDLLETGRYEILLKEGTCIADVKRVRTFDLVPEEKPQVAAPPPEKPAETAAPEPKRTCTNASEPSKLEVRPSKKLLRTGETFQFRSLVLDAKGCPTKTPTTWKLAPESEGKGVSIDGAGLVTVATDAGEGTLEIVATAAEKDVRVTLEVTSPANYEDLLARSGLNASGENDAASTAALGGSSIGAGEGKVEDRAKGRRQLFLGIVGGVLVLLGIVAALLVRRGKRAKQIEQEIADRHEARVQEVLDRKRRREAEHAEQQRAHEESVRAAESARTAAARAAANAARAAAAVRAAAAPELTCPSCGTSAKPPVQFCPHDGTRLVARSAGATAPAAAPPQVAPPQVAPPQVAPPQVAPPQVAPPQAAASPPKRGKICPTCGATFEGVVDFCGKDGTPLVLIN